MEFLKPIIFALHWLLGFYTWIVIASVIFSLLYSFNVINSHNQFVGIIGKFLYELTEPALRPIRRVIQKILPNLGAIDISPIFLLLLIMVLQMYLNIIYTKL